MSNASVVWKCFHRWVAILVFPNKMVWHYFDGTPVTGASNGGCMKKSQFSTNILLILEVIQDIYCWMRIGNHAKAFEYFQWHWMTPKVTLLFYAEYLRNITRYRHTGSQNTQYSRVSFWMTLSDLAKYSMTRSIMRSLHNLTQCFALLMLTGFWLFFLLC